MYSIPTPFPVYDGTLDALKGRPVFVLGLGSTGFAAVNFLQKLGAEVLAWDEKPEQLQKLPAGVKAAHPFEVAWGGVKALLKSPGVPEKTPAVIAALDAGVPLLSDIDLLYLSDPEATFIGITGTNGKSTTTSLIAHVLQSAGHRVSVGGNLGKPALELERVGKGGFYVLELSSYQLLMVNQLRCKVAVIVNISPDHLARHGTMVDYLGAKTRIFKNQGMGDVRVLSMDNYELEELGISLGLEVPLRRTSVTGPGADIVVTSDGRLLDHIEVPALMVADVRQFAKLPGKHNWQNIANTWACVKDWVKPTQFAPAVATFPGLAHRMQQLFEVDGVVFVNDSKATNADAANRALDSFDTIFWIAGGDPKTDGIVPCLTHLNAVKKAYLIGKAAENFEEHLNAEALPAEQCGTLDKATASAYADARKWVEKNGGKAYVVLAPACASWDQFDSFEHRGREFVRLAHALAGVAHPEGAK